jgi:hypothetical protein
MEKSSEFSRSRKDIPNNCFNLTQRGSVSQVKQMLDGFLPHIATLDMRTANKGEENGN